MNSEGIPLLIPLKAVDPDVKFSRRFSGANFGVEITSYDFVEVTEELWNEISASMADDYINKGLGVIEAIVVACIDVATRWLAEILPN
ncbi:hypothetical protein NECAME_02921 [Necator americanus]|uniref:Uncharacterized protein n=1 Tax=Necator americanus TaxID=51031 RepID=W2TA66_NECAM|nr:hypothetical protein NECAME_02921 [Necator americanus]ETN78484.1 hypothetical protein NECAME_02921 [Necator americanus]